jgi:hypothetical protein
MNKNWLRMNRNTNEINTALPGDLEYTKISRFCLGKALVIPSAGISTVETQLILSRFA